MVFSADPDTPEGALFLKAFVEDFEPEGWSAVRSPWFVARSIEERVPERYGVIDRSVTGMTSSTFDEFFFYRVPDGELRDRRLRAAQGWNETPIERARWLRERRPPAGSLPGIVFLMCRAAPFAAWGCGSSESSSMRGLSLSAIGQMPPGDWRELVSAIRDESCAAGWQLVEACTMAKPAPVDLQFMSLVSEPPHRVFDILFRVLD